MYDYYSIKEINPENTYEYFKERLDKLYEKLQELRKMNLAKKNRNDLNL